jgi:3-hydroxyisobutyrate dehydrogenase
MQRIAFTGLGAMGEPMASNLLRKGFPVTVVGNRRPEPVERLRALGASVAGTPAEAARSCDIALVVLPTSREVEAVIAGPGGLLEGLAQGAVVVDCSTSDPASTRELGRMLAEKGIGFVDAGLTRGTAGAKDGKLAYFVGGEAADIAKAKPALEAMGDTFFVMGPLGSGHATKVLSNALSYATVALVGETLMLGGRLGLDPAALQQALMAGAGSKALEAFGPRIVRRQYDSPRVTIGNVCAHLGIAKSLAGAAESPLFVTAAAGEVYRWTAMQGHGRSDMASIAELWAPATPKAG